MSCLQEDFFHAFGVMDELNTIWNHITPTGVNISTMTVIARAAQPTRVDLGAIACIEEPHLSWLLDVGKSHPACPPASLRLVHEKKRQVKVGQFGNQVTLAFESWSKRSIKVFSNGEVHFTGCKGLGEFQRLARVVAGLLFAVAAVQDRLELVEPSVKMLNCNFAVGCELSISSLWTVFERLGVAMSFETETHPALNVKLPYATPMIFRSGQVQISSRAALGGLLAAYRMVCQVIDENFEEVRAKVNVEPRRVHTRRRLAEVMDGYPAGQLLPCLEAAPKGFALD